MNEKNHISAASLPLGQNYKGLRAIGLDYIQQHSGKEWTNLNPSDPGVTFLDELCYALTELGYCTNFSMDDLLTDADGNLTVKNQFYLPEEILTTAPITLNDFRKYIIDSVSQVENVSITRTEKGRNVFSCYLKLSAEITDEDQKTTISQDVAYSLNRSRNLGQILKDVKVLARSKFLVSGTVNLFKPGDFLNFLSAIIQQTETVIFPTVIPVSYGESEGWSKDVNTFFSGPFLNRGAISDEALGEKQDVLSGFELVNMLKQLSQVKGVNCLSLMDTDNRNVAKISVEPNELIEIDWVNAVISGNLKVYANGQQLQISKELIDLHLQTNKKEQTNFIQEFNSLADINGTYRDINSYYSIQQTLPDVYGVGPNAIKKGDSNLKKAQSKQLKGYLTFFDQVLANQFSQLANLSALFSFENATVGAPSDFQSYLAAQSKLEKISPGYPAAFQVYSPTYFYQSVYDVPDVRPLLKGYGAFDFSSEFGTPRELEYESWKKYKRDPYNPYMKGLMDLMTDETLNLERRNELLNHLLARHGESPEVIDQLIDGSAYAGSRAKDQVVFKSLLLQNYGLLSYNRMRAFSPYFAAALTEDYKTLQVPVSTYRQEMEKQDFVLVNQRINDLERIHTTDFDNFSGVELKLSLLLGIKPLYKEFVLTYSADNKNFLEVSQVSWLLQEKRGCVLIESAFLPEDDAGDEQLADLIFLFPAYATNEVVPNFESRLSLCLQNSLPVNLTYQTLFLAADKLGDIFTAYAPWFNMQRYKSWPVDQDELNTAGTKLKMLLQSAVNEQQ